MDRRTFIKASIVFLITPLIAKGDNIINFPVEAIKPDVIEDCGFTEFQDRLLRNISSSMGVPLKILIKDYDKTNYSSSREAILDYQRHILNG